MKRTQTTYHASSTQYDVGSIIKPEQIPSIGLRAQVEAALTRFQPHAMISCANGLCVAHSAAHAMRYLQAEPNPQSSPIHVCEVMVSKIAGLSMVLVDFIPKSINHPLIYNMATEYRNLTEKWRFLESIVDEMEIVAACNDIDPIALSCAQLDYYSDNRRASER